MSHFLLYKFVAFSCHPELNFFVTDSMSFFCLFVIIYHGCFEEVILGFCFDGVMLRCLGS
jgi:hypothetical protein